MQVPARDERVTNLRHGELHLPTPAYASRQQWQTRARWLREHILTSAGLLPLPPRTPLRARIFGRIEREHYSVEKVHFESFPGFLVTGNLYRPVGKKPPFPAVLCPHGHWPEGRLVNDPADNSKDSMPGLCINLARQGYIAFSYDMVGYNDSLQQPHQRIAREWELWGIHLLRLQLWNSIRALDFLCTLKEVDRRRIACTGASGGGTQTFLLTAVDERVSASAPVCMVSAHYQGGCFCENAPGLRLEPTNNVEIAALGAPRPLLLVAATGDWTRHTMEEEYPAAKAIYALLGAEDKVSAVRFDAGHNYNRASREAVYAFFGKWLGGTTPAQEPPFTAEPLSALRVFPDGNLPPGYERAETVLKALRQRDAEFLASHTPRTPQEVPAFRRWIASAWQHTLGVEAVAPTQVEVLSGEQRHTPLPYQYIAFRRRGRQEVVIAGLFEPSDKRADKAVLLLHPDGTQAWLLRETSLRAWLSAGYAVMTVDPFGAGEHLRRFGRREIQFNFPETFNRTDVQWQIQDVLTAMALLSSRQGRGSAPRALSLVGVERAGWWALLAGSAGKARGMPGIYAVVADLAGCDGTDRFFLQSVWVPGIRRLGDWVTAALLAYPARVLVHHLSEEEARRVSFAPFAPSIAISPTPVVEMNALQWVRGAR